MQEALDTMKSYLEQNKPCLVVTVGPEMVMRAQEDAEFKKIVNGADLVVIDGSGILWAASRCGLKITERVAGVELIERFAEYLAGKKKDSLYLLGAAPGIAEKAGEKLCEKYPGLPLAGTHDGYFKEDRPVIDEIRKSGASVVYAALGSPKQEKWVRDFGAEAGIKIGVGVGGSFDVISGEKKRAPEIVQKLRLEWLYRMLCEPSRWRRFLAIPRFMKLVIQQGRGAVSKWEDTASK